MVDTRVVGEAEVEAAHRPPGKDGVVGDVFLVPVAVPAEQLRGGGDDLSGRQVVQPRPDDGRDSGSLFGVDVDVGERTRLSDLDEANVVVGDVFGPAQIRVRDQFSVVARCVVRPVDASSMTVSRSPKIVGSEALR